MCDFLLNKSNFLLQKKAKKQTEQMDFQPFDVEVCLIFRL